MYFMFSVSIPEHAEWKGIIHSLDIWHKAKKISATLATEAKRVRFKPLLYSLGSSMWSTTSGFAARTARGAPCVYVACGWARGHWSRRRLIPELETTSQTLSSYGSPRRVEWCVSADHHYHPHHYHPHPHPHPHSHFCFYSFETSFSYDPFSHSSFLIPELSFVVVRTDGQTLSSYDEEMKAVGKTHAQLRRDDGWTDGLAWLLAISSSFSLLTVLQLFTVWTLLVLDHYQQIKLWHWHRCWSIDLLL